VDISAMKSVVIVGAGVVGLFCAVRLAKEGARVTVLEAEGEHPDVFGPGASVAAAGMLAPFDGAGSPHDAVAFESFDLWRCQRDGAEWADGVRFDGGVILGDTAALISAGARHARRVQPINAGQVRKRTGLRSAGDGGVFVEDEGVADPERVLSGLAMQARALGVLIEYGQDVASAAAHTATTPEDRTFEADAILLAPGAWATDALKVAAPALAHVSAGKGHLVSVDLQQPLGPNVRGPGFYLAQRRSDVVLGSTLEPGRYDRRVDSAQVDGLLAAAEAALPGAIIAAGRAWCGIRPMSPDGWPLIGASGEGLLVAAGHSRNGWLLAPVTAEIITAYVFGANIAPPWAALSPQRFESQIEAR
jgi:glycine oxidase